MSILPILRNASDRILEMDSITIRKPDDWHTHLRDGAMLEAVLPLTARAFRRAIVMPNLAPNPVVTTEDVIQYRERILKALPQNANFTPLMTYYLTDNSSAEEIAKGFTDGHATAVKMYPAGATTNSTHGVTNIQNVYKVFEAMQKVGMPILLHGESLKDLNGNVIDPYDREKVFLDTTLPKLRSDFPELKIVLEHATTKDAIQFVQDANSNFLGSTITIHHLVENKSVVEKSSAPQYHHCMPVIKSEENQKALREAVTSGSPHFFLGTDSAPHPTTSKEKDPPAAGIFSIPSALELYTQVFEEMGKLENLEAFTSLNGPRFYGLQPNDEMITLTKSPWTIASDVSVSNGDSIRPFGFDDDATKRLVINWKLS